MVGGRHGWCSTINCLSSRAGRLVEALAVTLTKRVPNPNKKIRIIVKEVEPVRDGKLA